MLKENKNIDWDYTDRVVKQLVDETEIDFKNSRVRLDAAEFSFPFYSFGSRRAHRENIIFEPNSKFGKHVISNYGVDETEYKEIYAMYMGIIAARLKDHDENVNHLHLHESFVYSSAEIEDNFLDKIVKQLLEETNIYKVPGNYEYEIENLRAQPPFLDFDDSDGVWIEDHSIALDVLIDSDSKSANFIDFTSYCFDMYGLTEDESRYVWHEYRTALWGMDRGSLLGESKEDLNSYIHKVVNRMVKDTTIKHTSTIKFSNPLQNQLLNVVLPFDIEDDVGKRRREISPHYIAHPTARLLAELKKHLILIYGMDKWEADQTRVLYLSKILEKINEYKSKRLDESENKEEKYLNKVIQHLKKGTRFRCVNVEEVEVPYMSGGFYTQPHILYSTYHKYKDYVKEIYGLTDEEIKYVWDKYSIFILVKDREFNINESEYHDYQDPLLSSNSHDLIKKVVNQLMDETQLIFSPQPPVQNTMEKNYRGGFVRAPYIHKGWWGDQHDHLVGMSEFMHGSPKLWDKIGKYIKETYGLTDREMEVASIQYNGRIRHKIKHTDPHNETELTESVDLSYTDDKDFPFLNKLANHAMRETEIGRNAVLFPFIDGYISDGNFHKYFNSVPIEDIPFEASLALDEYLKDFGLTENEKGIWWDIYVVKVGDAVNERDLKIIDNYGELNESIEPEDPNFGVVPIYEKIANSIVKESAIFVGREDGKLHIYSPAFRENIPLDMVLDQFTGKIKRVVPNAFVNHLKEIYNIKYPTFVHQVWELYRNKMIERMEVAQVKLASREKKQQQFFDHIINTLVDETEIQTMRDWNDDETYEDRVWVTPPFLNHAHDLGVDPHREESVEWSDFSFFGYGYQRYMKEVYGLTDEELLKLWAPYYGGVKKRVEELIKMERKNIW